MQSKLLVLSFLLLAGCARTGATEAAEAQSGGQETGVPIDITISDRVRQALLGERQLAPDAGAIRVSTFEGVVTLRGFARSEALKQRAALVARAVGSVVRVDNRLVVDAQAVQAQPPMESALDHMITDRVRLALSGDKLLAAEARNVDVRTHDGVVRLSGTVSGAALKERMETVAHAVGSVKRVDNQLALHQP